MPDGPTPEQLSKGSLLDNLARGMALSYADKELDNFRRLQNQTYRKYLFNVGQDQKYYDTDYGKDLIPSEWEQRGFKPTVPPTAYNAVEAASDHILTTPEVTVPVRPLNGNYLAEQQLSYRKEDMLEYIWHNIFLSGNPLKAGKKKLIKEGKVVLKKQVRFDVLNAEGVEMGRQGFLWRVDMIPGTTVYEDPNNPYDPKYVYEAYMMRADQARALFPETKILRQKKVTDRVQYVEYWEKPHGSSKGKRVVWLDNERVLDKVNPYHWVSRINKNGKDVYDGYVPYFIADSGWGDIDESRNPEARYVGMVRHIHSLLEAEARQLTAADAQMRISTFPILKMMGIPEDKERPLRIGPGAKIHLNGEQDIAPMVWPGLDPAVFGMLGRLHSYTNELAKFEQLGGIPQRGVDTATEANQNFQSATSKLAGPIEGLRGLIARMNASFLMDIEHVIEQEVTVFGASEIGSGVVTMGPKDIDGYYETYVELKTSDQKAIDSRNAMLWGNLYSIFPGLDQQYAMKQAGIRRPTERFANSMMEQVLMDPRQHEMRLMASLAGQGQLGQALQQAVLAANIANPPTPGQAGGQGSFAGPNDTAGQPEAGQETRATAFGEALALNPPVGG